MKRLSLCERWWQRGILGVRGGEARRSRTTAGAVVEKDLRGGGRRVGGDADCVAIAAAGAGAVERGCGGGHGDMLCGGVCSMVANWWDVRLWRAP